MTTTNFISGTVIESDWLNDVDASTYTTVPANTADIATNTADIATNTAALAALAASSGSSLVGFLQSGTGAVTRTVQDKARETISPEDFGAVGDGVTDDYAALLMALNGGGDSDVVRTVDGHGKVYAISQGLYFEFKNTHFINFTLVPTAGFVSGTIDYTDMGTGAGGESAAQKTNRGVPLIRACRDDTAYTGANFKNMSMRNFNLLCDDRAPGYYFVETRKSIVENYDILNQKGYGAAWLVKNTDSKTSNFGIQEDVWGGTKQADPVSNPYNSAGFVQTCADIAVSNFSPHYCEYPIWADGLSNTQWVNAHPYNGNGVAASLPNVYVGPAASGIQSVNMYNDNGYLEMHSFSHSFTGGRFAKSASSANTTYSKLISQGASQEINSLILKDILSSDGAHTLVIIDEALGNITAVNNSNISGFARSGATATNKAGYAHNKTIKNTIAIGDWIADGAYYRYDYDIEPSLAFVNAYTHVEISLRDRRTAGAQPPLLFSHRFVPNGGTGTKTVSVYCDQNVITELSIRINEGLAIVT